MSLLRTKLYAPPPRPDRVRRPRLLDRLHAGIASGHRLTLVSAPAGYGKTTLITDWLSESSIPFAWLSLDAGDSDPARFGTYLLAALEPVGGEVGKIADDLAAAHPLPSAELLVTTLASDLGPTLAPFILVLDDCHALGAQQVFTTLQALVDHMPPAFHLVLSTREDPPLTLSRWRARGQMTELRADDLRFTPGEAAAFLRETMRLDLPASAVQALGARTEGWISGLQLAGLSLQGLPPERAAAFTREFSGSHRYVIDYLMQEVLAQQPPDVREFLCRTSILDRFTAPLCDAVTGRTDSRQMLARLEQANLFLVPLDDRREWHRYHHLFADILRAELQESEKAPLHGRAARWLEENGRIPEAVEHGLAAADPNEMARLVDLGAVWAYRRGEMGTIMRWVDALPASVLQTNADLLVLKAWSLFMSGRIPEAAGFALGLQLPPGASDLARGKLLILQAWLLSEQETEAESLSRQAVQLIPEDQPIFRATALLQLGRAQAARGAVAEALATLRLAYAMAWTGGNLLNVTGVTTELARCLSQHGQRGEAETLCREVLQRCVDHRGRPLPLAGVTRVALGELLYQSGRLDEARTCLLDGLDSARRLSMDTYLLDAAWTEALLEQATGQPAESLAIARTAQERAQRARLPRLASLLAALEADLGLRQGDRAAAIRWMETARPDTANPARELEALTCVRTLLAQGRSAEARTLLGEMRAAAEAAGRVSRLITIHILQALCCHALADKPGATAALEQAVRLAAPGEYRRAFLDEDPQVLQLVRWVRPVAPAFIDSLTPPAPQGSDLLTEREIDVLKLVAEGLSNAEIARKLFMTPGTAKWHVQNLLGKLEVSNRTQAVARARELHLL
ncbi:MAG: LuxR C-terminal-related transcriptional regulator [Bacillota bacterium]